MSMGMPVALINGSEKFGARKLAEVLRNNDIDVIEVGDLHGLWTDYTDKVSYIFDFNGDPEVWERAEKDGARLTVVGINKKSRAAETLGEMRVNWRIINLHGVYGVGMEGEEVDYLIEAIWLSVKNKNLVLPPREEKLRLIAESEAVELIMKANFLSGMEGQILNIWGGEVTVEELAQVLIEEAKMTHLRVEETQTLNIQTQNSKEVEEEWGKLRWKPTVSLKEGMKEVLQDFFVRLDEENRKPKINSKLKHQNLKQEIEIVPEVERVNNPRRFEVEVENNDELRITNYELEKKEGEEKPQIRPEVVVEPSYAPAELRNGKEIDEEERPKTQKVDEEKKREEQIKKLEEIMKTAYTEVKNDKRAKSNEEKEEKYEEIKPILVKNSNLRVVREKNDQYLMSNVKLEQKKEEKEQEQHQNLKLKTQNKNELEKPKGRIRIKIDHNLIKYGWMVVGGIWVVIAIILGSWIYSNYRMFKNVEAVGKLIETKKYTEASTVAKKTELMVKSRIEEIEEGGWNRWDWARRYQMVLKALDQGLMLEERGVGMAQRLETINEAIFKEKEIDWKTELSALKKDLEASDQEMGILQARLSGDWNWVPGRWKGRFTEIKNQVMKTKEMIAMGNKVVEILPEFIGASDGKRREYMVLFQNESEIRPTGGFIGSYGMLTFEGGHLTNFEIKDIYEADGQLAGHVEPPEPIKKILGEAKWFMRDANWQPDFGASARDIQWFLEKETGRKVDGIIGIDLAVAKGVLGVVGEVYVPDFKVKINKSNLYEQAEFYSETKFFPGSNQKASFLGGVGKQLFEEVKSLKNEKRVAMLRTIIDLLESNEIQLAMNNKEVAEVVAERGWDGAIYEGKCSGGQCLADYLYIVEANLGVNKANYFLYRNIDEVVEIGNQTVARVVKINYENTAKNSSWPGGDYKNYIRVYIPQSANLAEVSATNLGSGVKTIYSGENLKVGTNYGKKEVGFLVSVPVNSKVTVELRYTDQIDLSSRDKFSYLNYVQRQPGMGDTGLVTLVTVPEGWQANQAEPLANLVNGKLLFNQKLDKDIKMGVEITK